MGNTQAGEKQSKAGKSPAKGKHFIRNFNRKSSGRESKKHAKKKNDAKRDAVDREFDKTPDSDNNEPIERSDNETAERAFEQRDEGAELAGVQSPVTVCRCESRSATRDQPAASPANGSTSESVFTDPLTPLAVELNQCYYSAESDSAHDEPQRTLTPSLVDAPVHIARASSAGSSLPAIDMPHDDAASSLSTDDMDKEEKIDTFDDNSDRGDEKVMGTIFSGQRGEHSERNTHECNHDFRDNRLKASPGQTSFTLSKHRKVELPPVACDPTLNILDNEKDRRHSSVNDVPITDSNVLRKVASLTLDKLSESKIVRPKFVPEKLDFHLHEKFEGQMLLNWFLSTVAENNHLKALLNPQDLKSLGLQYFTHLLAAGVLRQICDKDAPIENIFKPNLMYYWAHMEAPVAQPVAPGRLHTASWPPKDLQYTQDNISHCCHLENSRFLNQNNNEEISDISEAKAVISQLRHKLIELEIELEKYKITSEIDTLRKSITEDLDSENNLYSQRRIELSSKEIQASQVTSKMNKLSDRPVINIPECDPHLRTNVNIDSDLDVSSITNNIENITGSRSEKIENYCKLNKSREQCFFRKEDIPKSNENIDNNDICTKIDLKENKTAVIADQPNVSCDSSSDASFLSSCTSNDFLINQLSFSTSQKNSLHVETASKPVTVVLYNNLTQAGPLSIQNAKISENEMETENNVDETSSNQLLHKNLVATPPITNSPIETRDFSSMVSQPHMSPPPPLPGMAPQPPPMPGTYPLSVNIEAELPPSFPDNTVASTCPQKTPQSPVMVPKCSIPITTPPISSQSPTTLESVPSSVPEMVQPPSLSEMALPHQSQPLSEMGPPPPPMPEMAPPPPPMPEMGPPPPPMPGMGPPPPPMPGMGPPPPPVPGMGPPPPPMPGMGPPPPPLPGMGPPPPPMPGMGPPPPPMPGMGPPPPPMPGMGPPPPPMPGMGPPPPPPILGLAPLPPPMTEMAALPGSSPAPPVPPPPNLGPVPFPAPPVGGWNMQRATLRKNPVKPAAPMRPLYWTRILAAPPPPINNSELDPVKVKPLWLEIEETKLDNIDEFADLFSRQVKAPVKKKVEVKTKVQPMKLLDSKRSQNVGILAQSLHVEFAEIENAIYNFDTSVVSLEALQQIYELRATEEELSLIKEHLNSKSDLPLDRPETFLHDLSGIPHFAERISCFMFQADFEDEISTTMHNLDNLKHTCEFLLTSESLKKLFAIILTLGNYMNGGNGQRGQADGFGLEILSKLKDVKSKQSTVTLLHFIVRTYMKYMGGALDEGCALPVPEPGDVARSSAIDFADVAAHLTKLTQQLAACKEKTKRVIDSDAQNQVLDESPTSDSCKRIEVFKEKMTTFINSAEEKLKTENENLEECKHKFIATVKFYQYTPKCGKVDECEPKEFFSMWTSFCSDFKDIYKKEEQIAIKEKLKEAKKLQEERRSLTQPKKEGGLKARLQRLTTTKK